MNWFKEKKYRRPSVLHPNILVSCTFSLQRVLRELNTAPFRRMMLFNIVFMIFHVKSCNVFVCLCMIFDYLTSWVQPIQSTYNLLIIGVLRCTISLSIHMLSFPALVGRSLPVGDSMVNSSPLPKNMTRQYTVSIYVYVYMTLYHTA